MLVMKRRHQFRLRKTLRNHMKGLLDAGQISTLGIDPGARAETLSIEALLRLHRALSTAY